MTETLRNHPELDPMEIGRRVAEKRGDGVQWKVIQRELGYGRTRLWQLFQGFLAGEKDVHEHLSAGQSETGSTILTSRKHVDLHAKSEDRTMSQGS